MKRTIRLNESELRRMISESIKEKLNEGVHRYKGFKCVNVSKDPSFPSYEIVSPDGETIGSTLFPSEMKEIVDNYIKNGQMNETKLRRIVSESVKRVLKEMNNDYEGNDLDYESIKMQAMSLIPRMEKEGYAVSWQSVAEEMGFRLETLNGEDMELLKDAIEDVMYEDEVDNPYWIEDMEFENDFQNLPYANESRKKANKLTTKILSEVTRRLKDEKKLLKEVEEDWYSEEDEYGNTGQPGMVRSYDVGYMTLDRVASEAQEEGMDVVDYLKYWFSEIKSECPWYWQKLGNGYGYHGNTIFYENGVTCKEIFDQIMFDEEEPDSANLSHDFQKRLSSGEYWMK